MTFYTAHFTTTLDVVQHTHTQKYSHTPFDETD
jgi:hypothetical protein